MTGAIWIEQFLQDIRFGLRTLRRNPKFTAVVALTLALGIGMNTAVFSVANAVLLRPLAYPAAERLVWLTDYDYLWEHRDNYVRRTAYTEWKEQAHSFERMTAYGNQDLALIAGDQSSQERIASITGDFWNIVGAQAAQGRLFSPGEPHAMVLSHALFARRFEGDPRVIGKTLTVNGYAFTIVGVLPAGFQFLFPQQFGNGDEVRDIDAYIPFPDALMQLPESSNIRWEEATQSLGPAPYNVRVVAKLRADVSLDQARAEMATVYTRAAQNYPGFQRAHVRLHFDPLKEKLVVDARRALIVLLVGVGFVLLIACANIANLLMARASTRRREIAVRAAMGAGRLRIVRQLLTESIVLALLGGAAGLGLAQWAVDVLVRIAPQAIPRLGETTVDARVLCFTVAVSLITGFLFGLGPTISMWRDGLHDTLKSDAGTSSASANRIQIRGVLVAAELALAIVLLSGAGLVLKSFWRMNERPPGFTPEDILVMRVSLSGPQYVTWLQKAAYIEQLLQRLATAPGVQAVGIDCGTLNTSVKVKDAAGAGSGEPAPAAVRAVSAGYLRAIGVPLLRGNWPANGDFFGVVVNESFARSIAGSGSPIGSHVSGSILNDAIVGVVADFKYRNLDANPGPEIYMPYERFPRVRSVRVVMRTAGDPRPMAPAIRTLVSQIDRSQPLYELQTLEGALSESIAPRRFNMFLLGVFAATAMLMALVGIYGVTAYTVSQRTHEIGIRMALGAHSGEIVGMVVRQSMTVALAGIVFGSMASLGLTRLMTSLLYEVKPNDPLVFAAVTMALGASALLACLAPAFKAARIDPIVALRHE